MKATSLTIPVLIITLLVQAGAYSPCHSAAPDPNTTASSSETAHSAHHPVGHTQHLAQSEPLSSPDQSADPTDAMDCCDDTATSMCAATGCAVNGGTVTALASAVFESPNLPGSLEHSFIWLRPYGEPDAPIFRPPIA